MSDFDVLFVIVCALYLLECVVWVPLGSLVFWHPFVGPWRISRRGLQLGAFRVYAFLAPVLPPYGRLLVCRQNLLLLDQHGFWLSVPEELVPPVLVGDRFFPFSTLEQIGSHGAKLTCNGKIVGPLGSAIAARHTAEFLRQVQRASESQRTELIQKELAFMLDSQRFQKSLASIQAAARHLQWVCCAEFGVLFVGFPLLGWVFGIRNVLVPLALCVICLGIYISRVFNRAHRHVYGPDDPHRGSITARLLLSPLSATRALDELQRNIADGFDSLAVAAVLCSQKDFEAEASRILRQLVFAVSPATKTEFATAELWYRNCRRIAIERLLIGRGVDLRKLLAPPVRETDECKSYCPRCCNQFRFAEGECADCQLPVHTWASPTRSDHPLTS
jgi:hypothetical protein